MVPAMSVAYDEALEGASWDLVQLLDGSDMDALLDRALKRAEAFAAAHRGKLAELDADALAAAMRELGEDRGRFRPAGRLLRGAPLLARHEGPGTRRADAALAEHTP